MTKNEAIDAMLEGKKVTHTYFTSDEWMTIAKVSPRGYFFEFEDGVRCSEITFWQDRTGQSWENGWSIFKEQ